MTEMTIKNDFEYKIKFTGVNELELRIEITSLSVSITLKEILHDR